MAKKILRPNNTANTTFQFTPNTIGAHTINITATDAFGKSATTPWTINSVAAEIEGSLSGGTTKYLGFGADLTLYVSKPNYTSDYTVTMSSNGTGTFSRSPFTCGNGQQSVTYTPRSAGTHTVTATIVDRQGKSKVVSTQVVGQLPTFRVLGKHDSFVGMHGIDDVGPLVTITIEHSNYPAGATFSPVSGSTVEVMWKSITTKKPNGSDRIGAGYCEGSTSVTDMWGQTVSWNTIAGWWGN